MKVKNDFVKIQTGNKTYIRRNMILNTYINRLFNSQLDLQYSTTQIMNCYVKFDTPIENVDYDTILTQNDFDVMFLDSTTSEVIGAKNLKKQLKETEIILE
jgi:hypothetical protein